jgi:acyl-CoA synthetase (AMP-forming)/AMP-acid ligase II
MTAHAANLGRLLSDTAGRLPHQPAMIWGERTWSWRTIDRRVDALVAALRGRGLGPGNAILVQARNSNQLFETQWASFKLGGIWTPCNFRLTPPEVAYIARSSGARVMIADAAFATHMDAVKQDANDIESFIIIGDEGPDGYENVIEAAGASERFVADVAYDDPCWFFYTSGTTGRPKAAALTHGQLAFVTNNHLADLMPGLNWARDASLVMAPLSHGAGAHALSQVARGVRSVLTEGASFDEEECWRLIEDYRITNFFSVPLLLTRLVRHESVDRYDHSSLAYVIYAGAPMYREDQRQALRKLGKVIVQYYGLGEVTGNITGLTREDHSLDDEWMRVGSCGLPRTGMEVAILDSEGRWLEAGVQGEICVRGPAVFAGYHNDPKSNAAALKDGWFHTGDLGKLDEAGYLYITGRASDMYISGGANVYPREAEEVLLEHPNVAEAAVLGVPDPDWGESGVGVLVLKEGLPDDPAATELELLAYLEGRIARYKWPRRLFFWEALPTSGYGKIPKHQVRERLYETGDLKEGEPVTTRHEEKPQ